MSRIHILGASGSGTTTLGALLARQLGLVHLDTDSVFWLPTDPPFTTPRAPAERLALLTRAMPAAGWVLSGSAMGWGRPLEPLYDLVVYLHLDPALRMRRLRLREASRHGARIAPGGDMAAASAAFLAWAEAYDTAGHEQRSRALHQDWLRNHPGKVLRLDSAAPPERLVASVLSALPG